MWHLISENNGNTIYSGNKEWMIDSADDITNGSEHKNSGSISSFAYTAGYKELWQKNAEGEWIQIGGDMNG